MPKVLSTVTPQRFARFGVNFPEDWEVVYIDFPYTTEEMIEKAKGCDYLLANATHPVAGEVIKANPQLKLIHSEGVAFDKIDIATAKECGIRVCNCRGANANGVAEHTVFLMMEGLRRAALSDHLIKTQKDNYNGIKNDYLAAGIHELGGKHIGFVGMGAIAKAAVKRLQNWNVTISYFDVFRPTPEVEAELGITYMPFEELIKVSDIISFHVPVTPDTYHMLNAEALKTMKPNAVIVNTARGEVIDQPALAAALENGTIAHASLDVLDPDIPAADHVLNNMSEEAMNKVTFTPHIAGMTDEAFITMLTTVVTNFQRVENGEDPINVVNA